MAQGVIENEIFEHFRLEEKKVVDAKKLLKELLMRRNFSKKKVILQ